MLVFGMQNILMSEIPLNFALLALDVTLWKKGGSRDAMTMATETISE